MTYDKDLASIQEVRNMTKAAKKAQTVLAKFNEEQVDRIVKSMVNAAIQNAERLARMAVEETGFGKIEDKIVKNIFASRDLYEHIKDMKTVGIRKNDTVNKIIEIAEPVGVIMGITPSTNPTSTAIFKAICALKSRNGIVMAPHPSAAKCTYAATKLMAEAAEKAGAPQGIIQCVTNITMEATNELMRLPEITLILATGGTGMVKAAYSAGKPAIGVGPGNAPAYIDKTADIKKAVSDIILSKTFDNSTICASEQSIIVEESIREEVIRELKAQGAYFMTSEETKKVGETILTKKYGMTAAFVGRSPQVIAEKSGITIPQNTKVLIGEQQGVGKGWPLSYEKLTTVLAFYTVKSREEACELCIKLLNNGGVGHTLSIHAQDENVIMNFANKPVFRILVNVPSSLGGVGALTGLSPTFTLGCGTWGGSSVSDNVTPEHLINVKRVAYGVRSFDRSKYNVGTNCPECTESTSFTNISENQIADIIKNVIANLNN